MEAVTTARRTIQGTPHRVAVISAPDGPARQPGSARETFWHVGEAPGSRRRSVDPFDHPARLGSRRSLEVGDAEAAGEPHVEAGQVVHDPGRAPDWVDPPVPAARDGDQARTPQRRVATRDPG